MANGFKRLAAGLLSLVLAMALFAPTAFAACDGSHSDEGIAHRTVRCPECGEPAKATTIWQDGIVGQFKEICIHMPNGTDTWGYRIGQSLEQCANCAWYQSSELKTKVLVRCYGSF